MRIMEVVGGTQPGAVARAYAAVHHVITTDDPLTIVLRSPKFFKRNTHSHEPAQALAGAEAKNQRKPREPREPMTVKDPSLDQLRMMFPELSDAALSDPHLLDGVNVVLATSGSTTGKPRLVGLSKQALLTSANATDQALAGPGQWILALPVHHVAGLQVLVRSAVAETSPCVVDTSAGFDPKNLLASINGAKAAAEQGPLISTPTASQTPGATGTPPPAQTPGSAQTSSHLPVYLSLVGRQLQECLDAGQDITNALRTINTILVGGSALDPDMMERAQELGLPMVMTYGMTETCGGCVYDGMPLPGMLVRTFELDGRDRILISGPMMMTKYLEGDQPFIEEAGQHWLLTGDIGHITSAGRVVVEGRADDVIISGGLSIAPGPVRRAVIQTPGVTDAWIVGTPDAKWGQAVTAAVVLDANAQARVSEDGTLDHLAKQMREQVASTLGRAHAPRVMVVMDQIPHRPTGKIDRSAVRHSVEDIISSGAAWRR